MKVNSNMLQIHLSLRNVQLPEPDLDTLFTPTTLHRLEVSQYQSAGLQALGAIASKASLEIVKNNSSLTIKQGGSYFIVNNSFGQPTATPWKFEHESDLEGLVHELKAGAIVTRVIGRNHQVIFTKEEADELFIRKERELYWRELCRIWAMDTIRAYTSWGVSSSLDFEAHIDTEYTGVFTGGATGYSAQENFLEIMSVTMPHTEAIIAELVRKSPYSWYEVEVTTGGILIKQYPDVRVMLHERGRQEIIDQIELQD